VKQQLLQLELRITIDKHEQIQILPRNEQELYGKKNILRLGILTYHL